MRLSPREVRARAEEARARYARCDLCAHRCLVDRRDGPAGRCAEGDGLWLAGAGLHFGEEPPLVGARGSGLILVGGCNLACATCETWELSLARRGLVACPEDRLAALLLDLQRRGAANANFVTPTHVLPAILGGLARAAEHGFSLPVVWNCGGYESVEALRLLDGIVDVYLPDAKYGDDAAALEISGCHGYVSAFAAALAEMHRQSGILSLREGLAERGVLVRHLALPGGRAGAERVMELVAGISRDLWVNVLSQYRPAHRAGRFPVLSRSATKVEVAAAAWAARSAGLRHVLVDGVFAAEA